MINEWDLFFCSIVSMKLHPGNKELLVLEDCASLASEMMFYRGCYEESVMSQSNPFAALVRMLEQRIARQKLALQESEVQLDAAKIAHAEHEAAQKPKK